VNDSLPLASDGPPSGATDTAVDRLNYFNYFTEIEEEFVRRRGKPLLISPMDWALIETWKTAEIPLHVVLRAINRAFDSYDARPRGRRRVNSILYCQQEVEATFAEYRLTQVGGEQTDEVARGQETSTRRGKRPPPVPQEALLDFITRSLTQLDLARSAAAQSGKHALREIIDRAKDRLHQLANDVASGASIDPESIERDFDSIDRMLLETLNGSLSQAELEGVRAQAEHQLRSHKKKMEKSIYDQTVQNFVARKLRDDNQLPRLSLFYL